MDINSTPILTFTISDENVGVNVIEEEDGKLIEVDPIIKDLRQKLEETESDLAFAKKEVKRVENNDDSTREDVKQAEDACKEIVRRIAELKGEITTYENRTEKLVIFTHRIVVVPDTPEEEELFNILMSILSQDTNRDTIYMYTDKNSKNQQSARKIRLRGTPGFIYSNIVIERLCCGQVNKPQETQHETRWKTYRKEYTYCR